MVFFGSNPKTTTKTAPRRIFSIDFWISRVTASRHPFTLCGRNVRSGPWGDAAGSVSVRVLSSPNSGRRARQRDPGTEESEGTRCGGLLHQTRHTENNGDHTRDAEWIRTVCSIIISLPSALCMRFQNADGYGCEQIMSCAILTIPILGRKRNQTMESLAVHAAFWSYPRFGRMDARKCRSLTAYQANGDAPQKLQSCDRWQTLDGFAAVFLIFVCCRKYYFCLYRNGPYLSLLERKEEPQSCPCLGGNYTRCL